MAEAIIVNENALLTDGVIVRADDREVVDEIRIDGFEIETDNWRRESVRAE